MAALTGLVGGWAVVATAEALDLTPPRVPWSAPVALGLAAAFVAVLARYAHGRIQRRRERIEPERAVALLVLGKATVLGGTAVACGYLGFALRFLGRLDVESPRERVIRSAVALVAGVALALAGAWLERSCQIPDDPDADDATGAGGSSATRREGPNTPRRGGGQLPTHGR